MLLNISLAGGQSLKWINHEREARMIYKLTTDGQTVLYQATIHCQHESILILTHKKIENMNDSFRFYTDSAILNRALEFPAKLFWTEMRILRTFLTPNSCKYDVTSSKYDVCDI